MKAIIIDDNLKCIESLTGLLDVFCPDITLLGTANDIDSGSELIDETNPELVFLDIELGEENAFDLLKGIKTKNFTIIFVTGHSGFGAQAFKENAVDYLIKPIDPEELIKAIHKAKQKRSTPKSSTSITKLRIPGISGIELVDIQEIEYLEADSKYTHIHCRNGQKYTSSKPIGEFEEKLINTHFFRVHRSYMVNLDCVTKYSKTENGMLSLTSGKEIEVSRRKKIEFLAQLEEFLI